MMTCLLCHLSLSVPRMAHIVFSGSCAKIDLWWIRGATGVTCLGCFCISYISASPVSLYTLDPRLLIVAGETPLGVFPLCMSWSLMASQVSRLSKTCYYIYLEE